MMDRMDEEGKKREGSAVEKGARRIIRRVGK
jgi:hypothetical protein